MHIRSNPAVDAVCKYTIRYLIPGHPLLPVDFFSTFILIIINEYSQLQLSTASFVPSKDTFRSLQAWQCALFNYRTSVTWIMTVTVTVTFREPTVRYAPLTIVVHPIGRGS